jgi:AcrR family transcriptional regulator
MAYRATPRTAARKIEQRNHLLDTAVQLVAEHGYRETTVPMIVKASGRSTGCFYFYFRSKEDVYVSALERFGQRIQEVVEMAMTAAHGDIISQMREAMERVFVFLAENPNESHFLIAESSGIGSCLELERVALVNKLSRRIEKDIQRTGIELSGPECLFFARCWIGCICESVRGWLDLPVDERPNVWQAANSVANFSLRGIGAV